MLIKRVISIAVAVAFVALLPAAVSYAKKDSGETQQMTAEVIDIGCYIKSGNKNPACASTCIANGNPVGLMNEKGKLFLAVSANKDNINELLVDSAGESVTVKGSVKSRSGMNVFMVESVLPGAETRSNMGFQKEETVPEK